MKKWEYQLLVQLWDHETGQFYWADHETDPRCSGERLDALMREGWETVLAFPCGARVPQHNYLLKRPVDDTHIEQRQDRKFKENGRGVSAGVT